MELECSIIKKLELKKFTYTEDTKNNNSSDLTLHKNRYILQTREEWVPTEMYQHLKEETITKVAQEALGIKQHKNKYLWV